MLKCASRCWTEHFSIFIKKFGFSKSSAHSCFYVYDKNNEKIFLAIYIDDKFLFELSKVFKISSIKDDTNFLGIEITKLKVASIFISQSRYIENIVQKFNLIDVNHVSTPIEDRWDVSDFAKDVCHDATYR